MVLDKLIAPLVRVPLFNGLASAQLRAIADIAERVVLDTGRTIVAENETGDAAYVLVQGRAARLDGIGRPGEPVPVGSMIGEMAMLIQTTHATTVVAIEPVKALKVTRAALLGLMQADPDIAAHFVSKLTVRLQRLADDLKEVETGLGSGAPGHGPSWLDRAVAATAQA